MKKVLLLLFTVFIISACGKTADFTEIKTGMTSKEVVNLVGEPDEKTNFFDAQIWMYKFAESGHIITIINDTVAGSQGGEDLKESLEGMNEGIEELDSILKTQYP